MFDGPRLPEPTDVASDVAGDAEIWRWFGLGLVGVHVFVSCAVMGLWFVPLSFLGVGENRAIKDLLRGPNMLCI